MSDGRRVIKVIEWEMLDKRKFFPLSMASTFSVRTALYPFTLIKTRLQIQKGNQVYDGTLDALRKISKSEGVRGLYKGFLPNGLHVVSGAFYIATYEKVRHLLKEMNVTDSRLRALVGGACGSLVGQTIIVPLDVISQRLMMSGQVHAYCIIFKNKQLKLIFLADEIIWKTAGDIYSKDGRLRGFYRGYAASLITYVPSSALWWTFYHFYQEKLYPLAPSWVPQLVVQCTSAALGGITTTTLMNPADCTRARLQVQRLDSIRETVRILWREERWRVLTKGLSARLVVSTFYSCFIVLGYETVKRVSIKDEYKHQIRW
nr:EOG090X08ST [Sida crystallina]